MKYQIVAYLLLVFSSQLLAEEVKEADQTEKSDEKIEVVGGRLTGHLDETTENVTIISSKELTEKNYIQLNDYLRSEVGLYLKQDAAVGGVSSLYVRGSESDHVLVLVNGMRITDPSTVSGAYNFTQLTVYDVERVEIVRGPKSVIYGSQAIGGTINIVLKEKADETAKLSIEAGSFNSLNASLQLFESYKDFNFFGAATVNHIDTNEDSDETVDVYNPQVYENEQAMLRMNYAPEDGLGFDVWYAYQNQKSKQINQTRPKETSDIESNQIVAALKHSIFDHSWDYKLSANYVSYKRDLNIYSSFSKDISALAYKGKSLGLNFDNVNSIASHSTLLWGIEYRGDSAELSSIEENMNTYAGYLEYRVDLFDRLKLSLGDRYENYSTGVDSNNWKLSLRAEALRDLLFVRGSVGTGFRVASLYELYAPTYGNSNLKPEQSFSWDAGLDLNYKWYGSVKWTFFRNDFENLIAADPSTFISYNIGKAMTYGNETEFTVFLHDMISASGGYTYLITKDLETGKPLQYRPQDTFFANLDFSFPWFHWQINYNSYSRSYYTYPSESYLSGYQTLNTTLTYANSSMDIWFRMMNVLGEEYEVTVNYPQLGRSYYFGIKGRF